MTDMIMDLKHFFQEAIKKKASDIHLVVGNPPMFRIDGVLLKASEEIIQSNHIKKEIYPILSPESIQKFETEKELDFSYEFFNFRFRINLHYQLGEIGLTARLILNTIPTPEDLGFRDVLYNLSRLRDGLILVTGPTGSGKSTTLAAMIEIINQEREQGSHIITIEDPIEYIFNPKKALIEQREVGQDTKSFQNALKHALRQDPNVIMVGEMRDLETISAALTAAETGHLVFSTLHTNTAAETVERIVDVFPEYSKKQILVQLSSVLRAVISQQLLPKIGGGRVAAHEILINNNAIASLIRSNKSTQIPSTIQTSLKEGMITMNKAIENLIKQGFISAENAKKYSRESGTKASYY